ncbi:MAG: ribokinase [Candidatus Lokiarchaeota archaeon]|nr:ribokinase [Candidatus Lokiarchaeota archaeon]
MVKITVLGSYNQDITMITPKIPQKGETVSKATMHLNPGGKGNNQAHAAHKLGAEVLLIAKVGKDFFGESALHYLKAEGISTIGILQDEQHRTGTATILVDEQSKDNMIVVAPGANHHILVTELDKLSSQIQASDICIFQFENNIEAILRAMEIADHGNSTIILNPAPMVHPFPQKVFNYIDILIMNEIEASLIAKQEINSKKTAMSAVKSIAKNHKIIAIITLGSKGAIAWDGKKEYYQPSYEVEVRDTTGAGDAFIGAFAVEYAKNQEVEKALQFATAAAAINITRIGASAANPNIKEVETFLKRRKNKFT